MIRFEVFIGWSKGLFALHAQVPVFVLSDRRGCFEDTFLLRNQIGILGIPIHQTFNIQVFSTSHALTIVYTVCGLIFEFDHS